MIVAPNAWVGRRTESLHLLVERLARQLDPPPAVVCWQSGPLSPEFAALAPTVDAGSVNDGAAVRSLAAAHLRPVARRLKTVRLRRLLAPMAPRRRVLLGGLGALAYHDWMPPGARTTALWLDEAGAIDPDPSELRRARGVASAFLVSDERSAEALASVGVPVERVHRVGEPVVASETSLMLPAAGGRDGRATVALIGATLDDPDVIDLLTVIAGTATGRPQPAAAWVHDDLQAGWARWGDDRFAGLEGQVVDWSLDHCRHRLDQLAALVVLTALPHPIAVEAAAAGVPVLDRGGAAGALGQGSGDEPLAARLARLLGDDGVWQDASDQARFRARIHDVDRLVDVVLRALEPPG